MRIRQEEITMINDYIDRQLAKTKDADLRIQEQLDVIYELAFGGDDNGTMDSATNN
jgi:hypothetical protein